VLAYWVPPFSLQQGLKTFGAFSGLYFPMASSTFYLPTRLGVVLVFAAAFLVLLLTGLRRAPRALIWWLAALTIPWAMSYWKPGVFLWYRDSIHMLAPFILLVALGARAIASLPVRTLLLALCLGSSLWGDWVYFSRWQKANPKAVVSYVHRLRANETLVVRPASFASLFQFYNQGTLSVIDEEQLGRPEQRAALKGRNVIFLRLDALSDPIGDALTSELSIVSARYFPGLAQRGITVYQLR
jgi:hypothetical protein